MFLYSCGSFTVMSSLAITGSERLVCLVWLISSTVEVSSVARAFLFSLRHMFHKKIRSLYPHPWAKLSACIAVFTPLVSPTVIVSNPGSASFLKAHEKSQAKTTFAFFLYTLFFTLCSENSSPG